MRSFIKLPKNRSFKYTPREYDERAENLEYRKKKLSEESTDDVQGISFEGRFKSSSTYSAGRKTLKQGMLLLLIFLLISTSVAYVYFGDVILYYAVPAVVLVYILWRIQVNKA